MNIKILNCIKKVIAALAVLVICSPHAAYAFSFRPTYQEGQIKDVKSLIQRFIDLSSDTRESKTKLKELFNFLKNFTPTGSDQEDLFKIKNYIRNNIPEGDIKDKLLRTTDTYALLAASGNSGFSIGALIGSLMSILSPIVDALMGILSGNSIAAEPKDANIVATTAGEFTDGAYEVNLHANVYINPNDKEGKWALVIHPFLMSGKTMANAVGPMYYENGYNVLAIDLRGFGDSEGTVALGFLEALDAYDWLVYMNSSEFQKQYNVDVNKIIVHGTSLGAATTNFLSGIDKFIANGPVKMNDLKSLPELKVIGLVEDCGYKDMEQFAAKDFIISLGMGLTEDTFDYYGNAINSLKHCELPMLIIHGDADTMVDYKENAPIIAETVKDSELVTIKGGAHALIMIGHNEEYEKAVANFRTKLENGYAPDINNSEPEQENNTEKDTNFLKGLLEALRVYRKNM